MIDPEVNEKGYCSKLYPLIAKCIQHALVLVIAAQIPHLIFDSAG
uniref:Uncharacterized protein n=1 Tax=Arundo donax TaxID=35708 RepID=A0A0A9FWC6_ARUDO